MKLNASRYHVIEALKNGRQQADDGELTVWDSPAVMWGITDEDREERNINHENSDTICRVEWESAGLVTLKFHEIMMKPGATFSLTPAGPKAIDPQQATHPREIADYPLRDVIDQISYRSQTERWDFASIDAASIAHGGYLTDYEFEYQTFL